GISHEENWSFYPNAVRAAGFCGNPSFHLYWPNKKKGSGIVVGCEATSCGDLHSVMLEYSKDASATQFRWIQKGEEPEKQSWAIDHVYIGEACPKLCSGHGYCTTGAICICDEEYQVGKNYRNKLGNYSGWSDRNGCGQLALHHGDSLYFNGCQIRQAVTKALDLTRASKIMFVLQIGSLSQTDSCNTNLSDPNTVDKAVLLQYSINNGITWQVIAQHQPKDFIQAQRVSYNVPL
ncbi:hypothetical protein E2320_005880, partial [Naja naja]